MDGSGPEDNMDMDKDEFWEALTNIPYNERSCLNCKYNGRWCDHPTRRTDNPQRNGCAPKINDGYYIYYWELQKKVQ